MLPHLIGVPGAALQDLRRNVIWRATNRLAPSIPHHLGSEAKISHFDVPIRIQKQVAKLQIAVYDGVAVAVVHGVEHLQHVAACFALIETPPPPNEFADCLRVAQLEQYVDVVGVLEVQVEADDVRVLQRAVDLDLRAQLREWSMQLAAAAAVVKSAVEAPLGGYSRDGISKVEMAVVAVVR